MTKVYLGYTQKELDDAYDQLVYAPNRDQILARMAVNSELVRKRIGAPERLKYGAPGIEGMDLYRARSGKGPFPVHLYIHGGAWRRGLAKDYAYPAETYVNAGAHYIAIDFNNVDETNGELAPMAEQVRRAIAWAWKNAASFGGDASRLYVSGTSSGAHFGGVAATTDWTRYGLPANPVRGYVLCSGMYDLKGPRLSKRSAYVKFTDEVEDKLSPIRHLARVNAPIAVLFGSLETPEFQRQGREFADALTRAGKSCEQIFAEHYNHFEIQETLGHPYGPLGRAVLAMMRLKP